MKEFYDYFHNLTGSLLIMVKFGLLGHERKNPMLHHRHTKSFHSSRNRDHISHFPISNEDNHKSESNLSNKS